MTGPRVHRTSDIPETESTPEVPMESDSPGSASSGAVSSDPEAGEVLTEAGAAVLAGPSGALEAAEFKDRWLRAEAELQNFRKRAQRNQEDAIRFAEDRVFVEMIEQLDDLERALDAAGAAGVPKAWAEGVRLVAQRISDYLVRQGLQVIPAQGVSFDPALHEALLEVAPPPGVEPGAVVEVVRKGSQRNGRALRAARVVVARREET